MGKDEFTLDDMLSLLPPIINFQTDLPLHVGERAGANPCGDYEDEKPIYKLLTREGIMITYTLNGTVLEYAGSQKLH